MVDIYMIKITFILSNKVSERTLNYNDQGVRWIFWGLDWGGGEGRVGLLQNKIPWRSPLLTISTKKFIYLQREGVLINASEK